MTKTFKLLNIIQPLGMMIIRDDASKKPEDAGTWCSITADCGGSLQTDSVHIERLTCGTTGWRPYYYLPT